MSGCLRHQKQCVLDHAQLMRVGIKASVTNSEVGDGSV